MGMSANQPRKPAGTPVGGQWAPTQHEEADIDLGPTGPTMTQLSASTREWHQDGQLHRTDGPALERDDGYREWYQHGKLHRDDGPAIEHPGGLRVWYQHGLRHRTDGPAEENSLGDRSWYQHGKLHRMDGPAVESGGWFRHRSEWWVNGQRFSRKEVLSRQFRELAASFLQPNGKDLL